MKKGVMKKDVKRAGMTCCDNCAMCKFCKLVLPVVIIIIALVPGWLSTMWAKWILVIAAILILLENWCTCHVKM